MRKNKMKLTSVLAIVLLIAGLFALTGCGGGGGGEKEDPFLGDYNAMAVDFGDLGVYSYEEVMEDEAVLTIMADGDLVIDEDGETIDGTYERDGEDLTISIPDLDLDMDATYDDDVITIYNYLDAGVDVIWAKDGTKADDVSLYVDEEEEEADDSIPDSLSMFTQTNDTKAAVEGIWEAYEFYTYDDFETYDATGDDCTVVFSANQQLVIYIDGENVCELAWVADEDIGIMTDFSEQGYYSLYFLENSDGTMNLDVQFEEGGTDYVFSLQKVL